MFVEDDAVTEYCGETSVALPIARPTFYFILDASGSMEEPMPGAGGKTRHWAARGAIAQTLRSVGRRVNYGAAQFPSQDDAEGCAPGEEVFEVRPGDSTQAGDAGADGPTLSALMFTLRKRDPEGSTPTGATLAALRPRLQALGPKTSVFLLTDGAPNCAELSSCESGSCMGDIEGLTLTNGMICGQDVECCSADLFPWLCLDEEGTNQSLAALAAAGVHTFVIGLPGTDAYADVLDAMAVAAGTARSGEGPAYYRVSDVEELAQTLGSLGEELALTCELELSEGPSRKDKVMLLADGEALAAEDPDGWTWAGPQTVVLQGESCQRWRAGEWDELNVVEGCDYRPR